MTGRRRRAGKPLAAVAKVQRREEHYATRRRQAATALGELDASYDFLRAVASRAPGSDELVRRVAAVLWDAATELQEAAA